MKNFKQYLMESQRTYKYRIKVVGDVDDKMMQLLELNLQKFSPVKIGEPKSSPIQKNPFGFPDVENERVTTIEAEFKYPVIEPFVKQMARLCGLDENRIRMLQSEFENSMDRETEQYQNQMKDSPVLEKEELMDSGKEASKDYADQYLTKLTKEAEKDKKIEMKFAGEKTKPAEDYRKVPGNTKSPLSQVTRMPRPETGASASRK